MSEATSSKAKIELRKADAATVMTLSAGKANALDLGLLDAIARTIDTVLADGAPALVITGDGPSFSGGLAITQLVEEDRDGIRRLISTFTTAMRCILDAPIPVIAAINGNAIAGGCVIALMCDERIMISETAKGPPKIGLNEAQLGLGLPAIVLEVARVRLTPASYTRVMLEGRLFPPAEAQAVGLVDEVVPPAAFEARVLERAAALGTAEPLAYAQIKRSLLRPAIDALSRVDADETEGWLDTWFSPEGQRRLHAAVARITKK